jgi:hypothetical protein
VKGFCLTGSGTGAVEFGQKPERKVFNARELRDQLEPLVKAEKCGVGNVCPHGHEYLLPKGKLR